MVRSGPAMPGCEFCSRRLYGQKNRRTEACDEPLDPSAPLRPVHARFEPARSRKSSCAASRRPDFRSRGRGRARSQGDRAHRRRRGTDHRWLRTARACRAGQPARHHLGPRRSRHRGDPADRCGAAAEGRERRAGAPNRRSPRRAWRPARTRGVVHDRDAAGGARGRPNRRCQPPDCGACPRHLRSRPRICTPARPATACRC